MVPIHDTDIAEERWTQAEWEHYELWEKIENRLVFKKRLWIIATSIVFLLISSIPILKNRTPKWRGESLVRRIAQEIGTLQKRALSEKAAFTLRFAGTTPFEFDVFKSADCSSKNLTKEYTGTVLKSQSPSDLILLTSEQAKQLEIPNVITEICFSHLTGNEWDRQGSKTVGFAVMPKDDILEKKIDRVSVLVLSGPNAEAHFD